ncbi:MAG: AsmA family protein, partial [Alphaproteobacteria bacterium]
MAAVALVLNLDPNDHTDRIAKLVEEKTGRKIAFGGPIELDLGLTTSLAVRDVSFSNATWGSRTDMATVGLVEMDVRLLPLIVGSVDIGSIILRDVDVLVETD